MIGISPIDLNTLTIGRHTPCQHKFYQPIALVVVFNEVILHWAIKSRPCWCRPRLNTPVGIECVGIRGELCLDTKIMSNPKNNQFYCVRVVPPTSNPPNDQAASCCFARRHCELEGILKLRRLSSGTRNRNLTVAKLIDSASR